ncbi:hypothetical protein CEXT_361831 [Caerostris extrusa]|uniref:Uncharacterized protein n=1 Tax=Caerostris extrusa TaxID=172846 RepID=A0AAV4TZC7_CAEEX|nr:hypothetical protein CEXT_361831 [Caerostris extrusa]
MLEDPLLVDLCFNTHHQLLPNSISRPSVVTEDLREPFLGGPTTSYLVLPDSSISRPSVVSEDLWMVDPGPMLQHPSSTSS